MIRLIFRFVSAMLLIVACYMLFDAYSFNDYTSGNLPGPKGYIRCSTMEVYSRLEKEFPDYKLNREKLEQQTQEFIKKYRYGDNPNSIVTIPVVVHVVYNNSAQNISDDQVLSQIDVLNADFRRHNFDTVNTPSPFKPVGGDAQIQFCMARRDPSGNPSLGIVRRFTTTQTFGLDNAVKFTAQGGDDAWDRNRYLNIWVCNLGQNLLGYAEYPGGPAATDGVVILFSAYGSVGNVAPPYNKGRTATHEVGHWLNLIHIWGDDNGACYGSDNCNDTPNQGAENYGCPSFPLVDNCTSNPPGVMFMNYMDYTDDGCMNIFTIDQVARTTAVMNGPRLPLQTSNGCTNISGTPLCSFTADSTVISYGGMVHFMDNSAGIPASWSWTCPGGVPSSSSQQNPAITYVTPGYYTVMLTVSNSFGSDSLVKTSYIKVKGPNMNPFSLVSPPTLSRIVTSPTDPAIETFTWTRSATGPFLNYKWKVRKFGTNTDYTFSSNSSGSDTTVSLRRSLLDSIALQMGAQTGDSARCTWRVYAFNGSDSLLSSNSFIITFVRNPIGIQQISSNIPSKFALYNNYPNPFNPSTAFRFDVAKLENVKITIYDILGREVRILVNSRLMPGTYSVDWDASNYTSGVYFYKLSSGDFTLTRKMVLIK